MVENKDISYLPSIHPSPFKSDMKLNFSTLLSHLDASYDFAYLANTILVTIIIIIIILFVLLLHHVIRIYDIFRARNWETRMIQERLLTFIRRLMMMEIVTIAEKKQGSMYLFAEEVVLF